jgi:hypothetical protein
LTDDEGVLAEDDEVADGVFEDYDVVEITLVVLSFCCEIC